MLKYLLSPGSELTTSYILKSVQDFQTRHLPLLNKLANYYAGKQKITKKQMVDVGRPNNISMKNYCNSIVKTYNGYLTGIPIAYSNDDFSDVIDILNYNDVTTEDTEYLKNALIYGRAFEVNYVDEEGKQRFRLFDTRECLPVYSNALEGQLLYVIRFYKEQLVEDQAGMENYIIEVYGPSKVQKFRSSPGFASMELIEEYPHFYGQCPVTVFSLNEEEESIFYQVLTLQDNYNQVLASDVDNEQAWADAYLVLKGVTADSDDLKAMREHRVLMFPNTDGNAGAEYLTKNASHSQTEELLTRIDKDIHTISNAPDLNDEKFYAQSGIAIRYKLVGFEQVSASIENYMKKALQRRIELITDILNITSLDSKEEVWRDVKITFKRNLPVDLDAEAETVNKLRGLVSDETLLGQLSFVADPAEELKKIREQEEYNLSRIEFGHIDSEGNEEEEY